MKKNYYHLLSILLIIVFTFSACGRTVSLKNSTTSKAENETTIKTEPDEDILDTPEAKEAQAQFSDLMDEFFYESVTESLISLHSVLDYPEKMGIDECENTIGDFSVEASEEYIETLDKYLDALEDIEYDYLTSDQQLLYDILMTDLQDCIELEEYYWFSDCISPLNGIPASIPAYLGQFSFNTALDVQDYIKILELIPDYYNDMMEYEKNRAEKGFAKPDFQIEAAIDQCNEFISDSDNHYLISTFNDKVASVSELTDEEKEEYKKKNEDLIKNSIIPSYESLITELGTLKGKCTVEGGLCQYKNGKDYYDILFKTTTNTDKTVNEVKQILEDKLQKDLNTYLSLYTANEDIIYEMEEYPIDTSDPDKILQHLIEAISEDFPDNFETNYNLIDVPEAIEKHQSPAYYYIPALDNTTENNIFINRYEEYADMDMVSLLAHEGFPGHMYQSTYFYNTSPDKVRSLLFYTGYLEGWGLYAELYSYELAEMEDDVAEFCRLNSCISYDIYCLADIGINYEGWSLDDTIDFITGLGYTEDVATEIYETLIGDPCAYLAYYVGYLEFMEMRDYAETELGTSYNTKSFHKFILDIGPAPFEVIRERFYDWIDTEKTKA